MKIRSSSELYDHLHKDLSFRKKELTNLKFLIQKTREHEQKVLLRASFCILYAHWEGFVKEAATAYLDFVSRQNIKQSSLSKGFLGVALNTVLLDIKSSKKARDHHKLIDFFKESQNQTFRVIATNMINTNSNLNYSTFENILISLGIDSDYYETKSVLIDIKLLKTRNQIAHGEQTPVEEQNYSELQTSVLELIESFKTDIENAVINKSYLIT